MSDPLGAPRPISMGDERLIEALRAPGCPLCSHRERSGSDYLAAVLYEQVNDGGFRERLLSGGGFCPPHTRAALVLDKQHNGGVVGAAILFRAALGARRAALSRATRSRRRGKSIREATGDAPSCPVCEQEGKALQTAVHRLVEHSAQDAGWRGWLESSAWCLVHLGVLVDALSELAPDIRPPFVQAQLARLAEIEARLNGFVHHSSHDRRAQQTEQERRAVDEAAAALSGVRRP